MVDVGLTLEIIIPSFETELCCVALVGLKFRLLLPQPPECWGL